MRREGRALQRWINRGLLLMGPTLLQLQASAELCAKIGEFMVERVDLILQGTDMRCHFLVLLRVFEAIAAVRRIDTLEVEIAASLTWRLTVTFYFSALALFSRSTTSSSGNLCTR